MEKYKEPEGYILDERTGLYYSQIVGVDETGRQVQVVTWFDSETGEYSQHTYPIEDDGNQTMKQQNTDKPIFDNSLRSKSKKTAMSKNLIPVVCGLLVIAIVLFVVKGMSDKDDTQQTASDKVAAEEIEDTKKVTTKQIEDTKKSTTEEIEDAGKSTMEQIEDIGKATIEQAQDTKKEDMDNSSIDPFPDYATCNVMTQLADEDDQYVYAIRVTNGGWMYESGVPCGDIVRFPKTGGEAEKMIESLDGIYSIAVVGDYIYYSVNNGGRYSYCRKNKNGGEEEQLFYEGYSLMQAYEGKIYLFFTEDGRQDIGIFDPTTSEMTIKSTDYALTMATGIGGKQSVEVFSPFSVYNGCFYYGGWGDYTICYGKYDFGSRQTQILSTTKAYEIMDVGYSDAVFDYINRFGYSPSIINDHCEIDIWNQNWTTALLKNRLLVSECDFDTQYFRVNDDGSKNELLDVEAKLPVYDEGIFMCGVSENWVIYNDRAVELSLSGEVKEVSLEGTY